MNAIWVVLFVAMNLAPFQVLIKVWDGFLFSSYQKQEISCVSKQNKINTFLFALIIFTSVAFGTYGYFSAETRYGVYTLPSQFLFLLSFFILVRFSIKYIKYEKEKEFWTKAVKLIKKVQYNNPKEVNHYYRNIDNIFKTKKSNSDNIKN